MTEPTPEIKKFLRDILKWIEAGTPKHPIFANWMRTRLTYKNPQRLAFIRKYAQ